jgi:polyhydroxybutyrate depolymerase
MQRLMAAFTGCLIACGPNAVATTSGGGPGGQAGSSAADAGGDEIVGPDAMGPSDANPPCTRGDGAYGPGTTPGSVASGGTQRTFRVHVPSSYEKDQPMPVVLMLHGGGGSGEQLETSANMDPIAEREGFITVYPNGTGILPTWNGGNCCGRAVTDAIDDVAFVATLLDHLESELCVDRRRIFSAGMSNGAIMSHRLACELSQRIAAVAPVAGTIGIPNCQPSRPVPVLQIHGTRDGHVPWDGGPGCGLADTSFVSVPATNQGWRLRNGCAAGTSAYFEQGDGQCTAFEGCQAPVVLCAMEGDGHSWPGGAPKQAAIDCPADGPQSTTFIASEAIWRFFASNPMPD